MSVYATVIWLQAQRNYTLKPTKVLWQPAAMHTGTTHILQLKISPWHGLLLFSLEDSVMAYSLYHRRTRNGSTACGKSEQHSTLHASLRAVVARNLTWNTRRFCRRSGMGNSIFRSRRPGRSSAGSSVSARFVAIITYCKPPLVLQTGNFASDCELDCGSQDTFTSVSVCKTHADGCKQACRRITSEASSADCLSSVQVCNSLQSMP